MLSLSFHQMCVTGLTFRQRKLDVIVYWCRLSAPHIVTEWCLALQWHFEDDRDKNSDTLSIQATTPNHSYNQFHKHTKGKLEMTNMIMYASLYNHDSVTNLSSANRKLKRFFFPHSGIQMPSSFWNLGQHCTHKSSVWLIQLQNIVMSIMW